MYEIDRFPCHGYETSTLVKVSYRGITPKTRDMIETMCKGNFLKKTPKEVMDFLSLTARMVDSCDEYQGIEPKSE